MSDEGRAVRRDVREEPSSPGEERPVPGTREPQEVPGTEAGNAEYDENSLHSTGLKEDDG